MRLKMSSACALLLLAGCAQPRVVAEEVAPPELIVDSVPRGAEVSEEGRLLGTTPLLVRAGHPPRPRRDLVLVRPGFHPEKLALSDEEIRRNSGQRAVVPLRPESFVDARPIDPDDVGQLVLAGRALGQSGRCAEAVSFYERALEVDSRVPAAWRGLGICHAKANKRTEALHAYRQYLSLAPQAPDAAKVRAIVSRAEGDLEMPPEKSP